MSDQKNAVDRPDVAPQSTNDTKPRPSLSAILHPLEHALYDAPAIRAYLEHVEKTGDEVEFNFDDNLGTVTFTPKAKVKPWVIGEPAPRHLTQADIDAAIAAEREAIADEMERDAMPTANTAPDSEDYARGFRSGIRFWAALIRDRAKGPTHVYAPAGFKPEQTGAMRAENPGSVNCWTDGKDAKGGES